MVSQGYEEKSTSRNYSKECGHRIVENLTIFKRPSFDWFEFFSLINILL